MFPGGVKLASFFVLLLPPAHEGSDEVGADPCGTQRGPETVAKGATFDRIVAGDRIKIRCRRRGSSGGGGGGGGSGGGGSGGGSSGGVTRCNAAPRR